MQPNKFKAKMVEMGITSNQLSKMLKVATSTLSLKINGKSDFSATEIKELIPILKLDEKEVLDIFFA